MESRVWPNVGNDRAAASGHPHQKPGLRGSEPIAWLPLRCLCICWNLATGGRSNNTPVSARYTMKNAFAIRADSPSVLNRAVKSRTANVRPDIAKQSIAVAIRNRREPRHIIAAQTQHTAVRMARSKAVLSVPNITSDAKQSKGKVATRATAKQVT